MDSMSESEEANEESMYSTTVCDAGLEIHQGRFESTLKFSHFPNRAFSPLAVSTTCAPDHHSISISVFVTLPCHTSSTTITPGATAYSGSRSICTRLAQALETAGPG